MYIFIFIQFYTQTVTYRKVSNMVMPPNFSLDLFKMIRTSYFPRVTTYPLPCNLDCLTCLDCCHIGQLDSHQSNLRKETFDSSSQTKHALGFDITQITHTWNCRVSKKLSQLHKLHLIMCTATSERSCVLVLHSKATSN